jgi:hypothetical protein
MGPAPTAFRLDAGLAPGETVATILTPTALPIVSVTVPPGVYYARLRAVSGSQVSAPSGEVVVHTGVALPPSAPSRLLSAVNGAGVDISWMPTFGGGLPTAHVLVVTGAANTEIPLPAGDRASFAGVPHGTYTVAVRAANAAGASAPSAPVTVSVPGLCGGPPQPPDAVIAYVVGRRVFVAWDPPATGAAATAYVLDVAGYGSLAVAGRQFSADAPPGTYLLAVRATSACGSSAPSPTQSIVVP